jgi:hypothetical protein
MNRRIFTIITPEGREKILGLYGSEGAAKRAFARKFPADWRSLCAGPLEQREPREGEKIAHGDPWTEHDGSYVY